MHTDQSDENTLAASNAPALAALELQRLRLERLNRLAIMDTGPEPVFESSAHLAARMCGTPIALVSFIDGQRQWFKANFGLPSVKQWARHVAFCNHAIRGTGVMEVPDTTLDERFADSPLVTGEPRIRFYAAAPIIMPEGECVGTVSVIDRSRANESK